MASFASKKYSGRIDSDTEQILSIDFYQHKAIMQAIQAPFKALEAGNFTSGLTAVRLSAYLLEQLAWANDVLEENSEEFKEFIEKQKKKILDEEDLKETDEAFKVRIAYAKIAFILKKIEFKKPSSTDYQV